MIHRMFISNTKRNLSNLVTLATNIANPQFRYLIGNSCPPAKNDGNTNNTTTECIQRAIGWIQYHQRIQPDGGVTSHVQFKPGKMVIGESYPEVTGYIIQTLLDYAEIFKDDNATQAALKAVDFELRLQDPAGFFPGGMLPRLTGPSVFNSAQIVHGLVKAYQMTRDERYLASLVSACRWICEVQESDGSWGRFNFLGKKSVYDTKVCQSLFEAYQFHESPEFLNASERNIEFVKRNQEDNGWFNNCDNSYEKDFAPLMHTIAYTIHGLLECYKLTQRNDLLVMAKKPSDILLEKFSTGPLSGRYYNTWEPAVASTCITGDAQMSLCWMELFRITGEKKYLTGAEKMNGFLKSIQYQSGFIEIDGAVPSSCPVGGDYFPYGITSWTVKYFTDALLEEFRIKNTVR
jgi:hypothetical protein